LKGECDEVLNLHKNKLACIGVKVELSGNVTEGDFIWDCDLHLHIFGKVAQTKV
jgi:hypothetical protein